MIEYLSYSSISTYLTCPESWRRRYIEREKKPTSPALVVGSAFHGAVEDYLTQRHAGNEKPNMVDAWARSWNQALENEAGVEWGADRPEMHYNDGLRVITHAETLDMLNGIALLSNPDGTPMIERRVELRVPGVPVPIIGYIDMIDANGVPGDFKTAAKSWSQDKAEDELQPLFYLAALNQAGHHVPRWAFRHYVVTKTKTPKATVYEHSHDANQVFWLFEMIRRVWAAIEAEQFPLNPTGWKCSPRYCEYYGDCRGRKL